MCQWFCPRNKTYTHESEKSLLAEDKTYQGAQQLTTEAPRLGRDSEDPQNTQDSYDCPTDHEDADEVKQTVYQFIEDKESNAVNQDRYKKQFDKLLRRRRYRRTILYLGNRKDLSEYKDHIEQRIRGMVKDLDPKPEADKVDDIVDFIVTLTMDASIRKQIINSVNNFMSAE
jgi:hypothetical protein